MLGLIALAATRPFRLPPIRLALLIGLIHLSASGVLDTSFGTGGEAEVALPSGDFASEPLTTLLVQPDGKIVVVGTFFSADSTQESTIVERFNEDGTPAEALGKISDFDH